jgi:outer membrane protein assembly factor BamE (lipoprotein component of BamABCDE complex)
MNKGWMLVCCALLGSCATYGNTSIKNETSETISRKLIKGVTTKDEVKAAIGDPTFTSFSDSGKEQWTYNFATSTPRITNFIPYISLIDSGMKGKNKSLVVLFDGSGIVLNYTLSDSTSDANYGIAPGALSK